jgi:hypothetical protein
VFVRKSQDQSAGAATPRCSLDMGPTNRDQIGVGPRRLHHERSASGQAAKPDTGSSKRIPNCRGGWDSGAPCGGSDQVASQTRGRPLSPFVLERIVRARLWLAATSNQWLPRSSALSCSIAVLNSRMTLARALCFVA